MVYRDIVKSKAKYMAAQIFIYLYGLLYSIFSVMKLFDVSRFFLYGFHIFLLWKICVIHTPAPKYFSESGFLYVRYIYIHFDV